MVSQGPARSRNGSRGDFPLAPVDPSGLAVALRPFGESRMLPPAAYTSAEVFAWERRHFFGGGWTCAAHGSHILVPTAADRTRISCSWAFAPEAVALPSFDPGYAVDFWDLTNRQDWTACESVQRGLASPFASAGPLATEDDAIYSYVTTVARGYLGSRVRRGRMGRGGLAGRR